MEACRIRRGDSIRICSRPIWPPEVTEQTRPINGEPKFHELEPDWRMAQTPRRAPMGGLSARPLFFPVPEFRKASACITTIHVAEQRCDWTFLVHS